MPSGDFSASQYPKILTALSEIHIEAPSTLEGEMMWPTPTAEKFMAAQTVRTEALRGVGQDCREVDAYFHVVGSHLEVTAPVDCDLADGPELQTDSIRYANNLNDIWTSFKILEPRCNNATDFTMEMAKGLTKAMATIRRRINTKYIQLFDANAQANQATGYTEFAAAAGGANRLRYNVGTDNFSTLRGMELFAADNYLGRTIFATGQSFYRNADISQYYGLDDDKRSQAAIFADSEMVFDPRNIDQITGAKTTFIVDPSVLIFWNHTWYSDTPTIVDPSTNYTRYTIADPSGAMWRDNGSMRPLRYHVETKFECVGRNANKELQYGYTVNVSIPGGLHKAPDGYNWPLNTATAPTQDLTGILVFRQENAV